MLPKDITSIIAHVDDLPNYWVGDFAPYRYWSLAGVWECLRVAGLTSRARHAYVTTEFCRKANASLPDEWREQFRDLPWDESLAKNQVDRCKTGKRQTFDRVCLSICSIDVAMKEHGHDIDLSEILEIRPAIYTCPNLTREKTLELFPTKSAFHQMMNDVGQGQHDFWDEVFNGYTTTRATLETITRHFKTKNNEFELLPLSVANERTRKDSTKKILRTAKFETIHRGIS